MRREAIEEARPLGSPPSRRLRVLLGILLACGGLLLIRLADLQILQHEELARRSERQYEAKIGLMPRRGLILDRNGAELAISVPAVSVYVNPSAAEDPQRLAVQLAGVLRVPEADLRQRFERGRHFAWVSRQISPSRAKAVEALVLAEVGFVEEPRRYYPHRELASDVLGFVGTDQQGLEGLERQYERLVSGRPGQLRMERDARGRAVYPSIERLAQEVDGYHLVLTLDQTIQYIAEKELGEQVRATKARSGMLVVMDPRTGQILALADNPSFNPNDFTRYDEGLWRNRVVSDQFEPGSTFKIITLAAALNEGVTQLDEMIFAENGTMRDGNRTVHDVHPYGWLTVREVVSNSSNIGAIKLGRKLGEDLLYQYARAFGFGEPTGVDLPGEAGGLLRPPNQWSRLSLGSLSMGQEIGVTALQLIAAAAAVANDGERMRPYLIHQVLDPSGKVLWMKRPRSVGRVVSAQAAWQVTEVLEEAVRSGTGQAAAVEGFRVAGKTGTAQKFDARSGGYSPSAFISSFVGFFPANAPRFAILVVIDEPQGVPWGGAVAAPVFSRVARQIARYALLPPEGDLLTVAVEPQQQGRVASLEVAERPRTASPWIAALPDALRRGWTELRSAPPPGPEAGLPSGRAGRLAARNL